MRPRAARRDTSRPVTLRVNARTFTRRGSPGRDPLGSGAEDAAIVRRDHEHDDVVGGLPGDRALREHRDERRRALEPRLDQPDQHVVGTAYTTAVDAVPREARAL